MVWNVPKKNNEKERSGTFHNYQEKSKLTLFTCEDTNFKGTFQSDPERSGTFQNVLFHYFSLERSKSFVFKIACDDTYAYFSEKFSL